jgi:type VII secretion-associated serine protease mycosin
MVTSMTRSAAGGRAANRIRPFGQGLLSVLVVAVLAIVTPGRAAAAANVCSTTPSPQPLAADVPWPQQRYDFAAIDRISTGAGVTVAVIDSGVDMHAPQLTHAVASGYDMLNHSGDGRQDCVGHGTAVASIIAASPQAGAGLLGLAPDVRILPVRVSERVEGNAAASGQGTVADLAAGIRAAINAHPRPQVVNLSISTTENNPDLRSAIAAALADDIVVVAAVGNDDQHGNPTPYPAAYPGVVGVGAIGKDGLRVASSQVGPYVDLVAPGSAVMGATPGRGQQAYEGTSFATPFVAATAALIRARYPNLHQADVVARLLATADPAVGAVPSPQYGYGVVNPMRALTELVDSGPPPKGPGASPLAVGPPAADGSSGPDLVVVGFALALVLGTIMLAAVAAAVPAGRRRRWRAGGPVPTLLAPPTEEKPRSAFPAQRPARGPASLRRPPAGARPPY